MDRGACEFLLAAISLYLQRGNDCTAPSIVQGPVEWNKVFKLAEAHGVTSLLFQALAQADDQVGAAACASLRRSYESNIHKTLFLARELMRILDCLHSCGIEVLPYKGIVLSELYYGDMAMRQSGDMDLFIRAEDLGRAKMAVRDLGYTPRVAIPDNAEADYVASGYECTFDSTSGKNLLELQWALQPRFYAVDYDMDGLFGRAVSVEVAGRSLKTPSAEDLLIILSVHAAKHVWGRLIWLCDIAQVVKQATLNWDWVRAESRALGVERILHITMLLANRLLGMQIPSPIESEVEGDYAASTFAEQIATSIAAGVLYEEEKLSYFALMMRLRERRSDRLRFFTRLAFTPGPGEWEAVRLPKRLFPFYRVVRLGRLAKRFARG